MLLLLVSGEILLGVRAEEKREMAGSGGGRTQRSASGSGGGPGKLA